MTRFKKQLEAARAEHQAERYSGDLAGVLLSKPSGPARGYRRTAAGLFASAAGVLIAVGVALQDRGDELGGDVAGGKMATDAPPSPEPTTIAQTPVTPADRPEATPLDRGTRPRQAPWSASISVLSANRNGSVVPPRKPVRFASLPVGGEISSSRVKAPLSVPPAKRASIAKIKAPLPTLARRRLLALIRPNETASPKRGAAALRRSLGAGSLSLSGRTLNGRS